MSDNKILEALKRFLENNVANKFKLEKPNDALDENYELVNPAVYIGWVPPKNYLNEYGYDVPSLLIMEDSGEDTGNEASLDIRIGIATYDPGLTTNSMTLKTEPNFKGYKDLLNVIQRIRIELSMVTIIGDMTTIIGPIRWGMYEEQQYPYWHGWVSFKVSTVPLGFNNIEKLL